MPKKIRPRGDIKAKWEAKNPILGVREMGIEWEKAVGVGPARVKYGNGVDHWLDLSYSDTDDLSEKIISKFIASLESNPPLEEGDSLGVAAGKLNAQQDFLKRTLGYERIDALADVIGGLPNKDFMGVLEFFNQYKFDKSSVYNGLDSSSITLAASAKTAKDLNDKVNANTTAIAEVNSDLSGENISDLNYSGDIKFRSGYYTSDTSHAPDNSGGNVITAGNGNSRTSQLAMSMSGCAYTRRCYGSEWTNWSKFLTNSDFETGTVEADVSAGDCTITLRRSYPSGTSSVVNILNGKVFNNAIVSGNTLTVLGIKNPGEGWYNGKEYVRYLICVEK